MSEEALEVLALVYLNDYLNDHDTSHVGIRKATIYLEEYYVASLYGAVYSVNPRVEYFGTGTGVDSALINLAIKFMNMSTEKEERLKKESSWWRKIIRAIGNVFSLPKTVDVWAKYQKDLLVYGDDNDSF
jgi:hypothetical protein